MQGSWNRSLVRELNLTCLGATKLASHTYRPTRLETPALHNKDPAQPKKKKTQKLWGYLFLALRLTTVREGKWIFQPSGPQFSSLLHQPGGAILGFLPQEP